MIKFYNICTKKTFNFQGQERTKWLPVGTLKVMDDGKQFIELNIFPNENFYIFEQTAKEDNSSTDKPELKPATTNSSQDNGEVSIENIPF